jgi:two-component system KDP operon response regulator KdpE
MGEGDEHLVLLIEDEAAIGRFLRTALAAHGCRLIESTTGEDGLQRAAAGLPDLVIVDLGLPDIDGIEVIRRLREWSATPIIVLSARAEERHKVEALEAGADDYVSKPFAVGELIARMRVAWRHAARAAAAVDEPVFEVGDLRIDRAHRRVSLGGRDVYLTPYEYRLLVTLSRHAGKVLTQQQLLKEVWGPAAMERAHYLRVYMGQLRRKLEADSARPRYLLTEPGVGYRLAAE